MTAMPHAFIGEGKRALSNMVLRGDRSLTHSRAAKAICTSAVATPALARWSGAAQQRF